MAFSGSENFQSARTRDTTTAPYFPPPPSSASNTNTKKNLTRTERPPPIPLTVNIPVKKGKKPRMVLAPPPQPPRIPRRSSLRHRIGQSSMARKKRLNELPLPAIKLSPRHWILVGLLFLSFLSLILGFIYADCVALPHTTDDSSTNVALDPNAVDSNSTTTLDAYEADETRRLGFDTPKNLVILFFYTTTLPFATMFHVFVELVVLCYAKKRTTAVSSINDADNNDEDDDLKSLSLAKKHNLSPNTTSKSSSGSRFGVLLQYLPALSLTASLLLIGGWTTITAIQAHCEIPISTSTSTPSPNGGHNICPIQTRGHYMHGIHELSIVKTVLGVVLVLSYAAYAVWCLRVNGLIWKAAREERCARRQVELEKSQRMSVVRFTVPRDEGEAKKSVNVSVVGVRDV